MDTARKEKVLIIKVGYSETLDPEISSVTSYGDVLRSTVLLNLYKDAHVTWLVDAKAYPVLKGNPYIDRILIYDLTSVLQLSSEHFDTVINLEKVPGLCALSEKITAWRRFGFRFDCRTGEAEAYDGTQKVLDDVRSAARYRRPTAFWQQTLFEMVGARWDGEEYVLGYRPTSKEIYDIGFNHAVGNKWPLKAWPEKYWHELEGIIGDRYTISWQQGLSNMEDYFEWINSCKTIVTNDSFGLHLALALGKKVVAMFGPTPSSDVCFYGRGVALQPEHHCTQYPCKEDDCLNFRQTCMELISPEVVAYHVDALNEPVPQVESIRVDSPHNQQLLATLSAAQRDQYLSDN